MLLNGTLVSRAGTALVAMAAHERGVRPSPPPTAPSPIPAPETHPEIHAGTDQGGADAVSSVFGGEERGGGEARAARRGPLTERQLVHRLRHASTGELTNTQGTDSRWQPLHRSPSLPRTIFTDLMSCDVEGEFQRGWENVEGEGEG